MKDSCRSNSSTWPNSASRPNRSSQDGRSARSTSAAATASRSWPSAAANAGCNSPTAIRCFPYDRLTVVGTDEEFRIFHRVLDEQRSERKRRREEKTATALRIGSYTLPARSALDGTTLGEAEVRRHASALVLGIERPEGPVTNPSAGERLRAGDVVWAVGDPQRMKPFFEAVRQE